MSLKNFANITAPLVILDAYFEKLEHNYIVILGICVPYPISNFNQRADGFYKAVRENGMLASRSIVHWLTPSQKGAYSDMKVLLQNGEKPAGCYFADNDLIAAGALQALREFGYRVPEDVAIIGFDDLPLCEYLIPKLSTIEIPKRFMGETAAARIIQVIENKNILPLKIEIFTKLIRRKSV